MDADGRAHRSYPGQPGARLAPLPLSTLFTAEQLRRFLEGQPAAMFSVAQGLCERLADAEARIASAARDNADRRLARLLCDLERYGTPDWAQGREGMAVPVPFTHAELVSWVGVSRETVDRALRRWRARHIVSTSVRKIVIHDVEALARIAGIKVTRRPAVRPGYGRIIAREVTIGDLRRALAPPQPRVGSAPLTGVNKP